MAVKMRLRRVGAKKQPAYRIVIADARAPRDGRFIEIIGHHNPLTDPPTTVIKNDRALYWLQQGAQPSDVVHNLLVRKGIWAVFTGAAELESLNVPVEVAAPAPVAIVAPAPVEEVAPVEEIAAAPVEAEAATDEATPAAEESATAEEAEAAEATTDEAAAE